MMRISLWNALLLIRPPVQALLKVLMGLHLIAMIAGTIMIFTGYGLDVADRVPVVYRMIAPLLTGDDVWQGPEVIDLVTEATSIVDQPRRKELYAEALSKITEEAYWVPLWTFSMNTALAEDLELSVDPDEFVPFWNATWK